MVKTIAHLADIHIRKLHRFVEYRQVFKNLYKQLKELKLTIDNLPFPVSVPPGVGVPYSVIGNLQSVSDFIKELEKQNKDLNKQIIIALIFLVAALTN